MLRRAASGAAHPPQQLLDMGYGGFGQDSMT
jgi:hypothetical protein